MTHLRRCLLGLALGFALALCSHAPARAAASPIAEAWYATPPTCALPTGCGPTESLPASTRYPPHTLHVGVTAGVEDARTYLKFDVSFDGATLTIPVQGSDSGTANADTAQVEVCLAAAPFDEVEGSSAPPPEVDCSATAVATYKSGSPATLSAGLAPLVAKWESGAPNYGIALVPRPAATDTTWHIAFSKGTASLTEADQPTELAAQAAAPNAGGAFDEAYTVPSEANALALSAEPQSVAPIVAEAEQPSVGPAVAAATGSGFAYPIVMALPLALVAAGGYLGWALNRPIEARTGRARPPG